MKRSLANGVALLSTAVATAAAPVVQRPNIILFLVDDMGWQDTSVPFWSELTANNCKYETPNMEALAAKGMKFTQAYASSISSSASSILCTKLIRNSVRLSLWRSSRMRKSSSLCSAR